MNLILRALRDSGELTRGYIEQLAKWHHEEWLHLNPGAKLEQRLLRYEKSIDMKSLPEIFVASDGDKLIGSATLEKEDMDTRAFLTPWLASLFVEPEYREQGVASQLIQYVIDYSRQQNYKNIYLFTEDQTDYYKKRGWHFVETLEYRSVEVDLMNQKL